MKINNSMIFYFGIASIGCIIFLFRNILYDSHGNILDYRYIFLTPIYLILAKFLSKKEDYKKIIAGALIIQGAISAFIFIINVHFYPGVLIELTKSGTYQIIFDGNLTRSMLLGASISGNMILVSMFVLSFLNYYDSVKIPIFVFLFCQLALFYAITLGGSRFPLAVGCVILFLNFFYGKISKLHALLLVLSLFGLGYLFNFESHSIWRFNFDSGDRIEKFLMPITLLFQDSVLNFLIGATDSQAGAMVSTNGNGISDNSYLLIGLSFGVLFSFFFFMFFFSYFVWNKTSGLYKIFSLYLVINFELTNSILWESWLFVAIFCWFLLSTRQNDVCLLSAKRSCSMNFVQENKMIFPINNGGHK